MTHARRVVPEGTLTTPFQALRDELDVPRAFPDAVLDAAAAAATGGPSYDRRDATDIPLVTIDPPGSRDLDQAVWIGGSTGGGLTVQYAIADVAAFVLPGDAIDQEAWSRGVSRYSPDLVTPLHPEALSTDAASLLPDQDRPALLWTMELDDAGALTAAHVERALVRSRAQLTYAEAQQAADAGYDEMLGHLALLGRLRAEREWVRGGISLALPDQEVHRSAEGYELRYRAPLPVEGWNAQVSLLTGIAAGRMMTEAGVGVLRTLPAPDVEAIGALRRRAAALGLPWPAEVGYADFVRTLDPHDPVQAAMIQAAAVGLRGAGYVAFDGVVPEQHRHEAIASVYAHVTAPLRRLVDRYAGEIALAVSADRPVPAWVIERMEELPRAMASARGRAATLDRAVLDLVEASVMAGRIGRRFAAAVVRSTERGSTLQLRAPAVTVRVPEQLPPGAEVVIRVVDADPATRTVAVEIV